MPATMTPIATYRLQLTPSFGFDAVGRLVPRLAGFGVSHLYLSPIAEAVPGSTHGYDVVDHTTVRAELGGEAALGGLLDTAHEHGLGVLVDHVPNHTSVAVAHLNRSWWAMLRDGAASDAARWFDVDWDAGDGRVIVPKLGKLLDDVIAADELALETFDGEPVVRYFDQVFPVAPGTGGGSTADVLARQHYELVSWREQRRNVRRFFTIDDLAAVRVEEPDIADRVDTIIARLTEHPAFAGVRIDHVDGLADPGTYLRRLRELIGDRWLLVEKILAPGETLPADWPVDGTTGYEHIVHAEHALLDPAAEQSLIDLWSTTGRPTDFDEVEERARREVLDGGLAPDVDRLLQTIIAGSDGLSHPADVWRTAVIELTVGLDRYRTYLPDDPAADRALDDAVNHALAGRPELSGTIADLVGLVRRVPAIRNRWQQLSGPVMAKGAEDRAFYRYVPLAGLSEVGGAPGRWALGADEFHAQQLRLQEGWPLNLLASTTHDTKRSETVRARSLALAAHTTSWTAAVSKAFDDLGGPDDPLSVLDRADVLLALQTAVTAAPIDAERLADYLIKSTREAELRTSWTEPDDGYEGALNGLAVELTASHAEGDRWRWVDDWSGRIIADGLTVDLRLRALHLTGPGVPDLYQGSPTELVSLVDPDNRRPPDWDAWTELVGAAPDIDLVEAWSAGDRDRARAALIQRLLALRGRHPGAFGRRGGYSALAAGQGTIAFARRGDGGAPVVVTIVTPFRSAGEPDVEIELPEAGWHDVVRDVEIEARTFATGACWSGPTAGLGVAVLERIDL